MSARLPNDTPRPPGELERLQAAWQPPRGWRLLSSVNNRHVGVFYLSTALLFFVAAGLMALAMRAQLARPGLQLVPPDGYAQLFTMHGTVMMFLFAVPVVLALAVWLLPAMLGARDLPFPRLSACAFWVYAFGGTGFLLSLPFGAAPDGGWFMTPPLANKALSPGIGTDFWLLGTGFIEIAAIAGAVQLIVGVLLTRAPGMTLARMPVYAWSMLVVGAMIVFAFPALVAGTALLALERRFDWPFFDPGRGGDPLLWQHLFWFFGHPEVYIIFLPAAGLLSMLVPVLARRPLVGRAAVVAALVAVGGLSFALWMHHMFSAGLSRWAQAFTALASLAVALPTALQVFAWLATAAAGRVRWTASTWFVAAFFASFVPGGLTGVMLAMVAFDGQVHDTHFVVAHLHHVLVGGLVFPLFAALYHWAPLLRGWPLSERRGRVACALMFAGFHLAFGPMHAAGLAGMPRRVHSYPDEHGLGLFNALSSAGALLLAAGVALVAWDLWRTQRRPAREPRNPWRGATLEWLPNRAYGLRSVPQVDSAYPLWTRRTLRREVEDGAHWLPGNPTGGREALQTSWRHARPTAVLVLPGDGWWPFAAAAGTVGGLLLMTLGWAVPAALCAVVAAIGLWVWLWGLDEEPPLARAFIGRGVEVPVAPSTHARLGLAIVLVVDATVFLSLLWAHLHLALAAPVCPPPGAALPPAAAAWGVPLLWALAAVLAGRATWPAWAAGAACALAAFALDLGGQWAAGLSPRADGWSASVAALLAYGGLHALLVAVMAVFVLARRAAGLLSASRHMPLVVLRWTLAASALQALGATLTVRLAAAL
jgi:cytochrome c oxidase subunit I+III